MIGPMKPIETVPHFALARAVAVGVAAAVAATATDTAAAAAAISPTLVTFDTESSFGGYLPYDVARAHRFGRRRRGGGPIVGSGRCVSQAAFGQVGSAAGDERGQEGRCEALA